MHIVLPEYAFQSANILGQFDRINLLKYENTRSSHEIDKKTSEDEYVVTWGDSPIGYNYGKKYGVMETGFFCDAAFIDTIGNYQNSSLNTPAGIDAVRDFALRSDQKSARELVFGLESNRQSKYNSDYMEERFRDKSVKWNGVVLALQNPKDRSIMRVTNLRGYYEFVEDCCKYYGKELFVKFHPWNSNEIYDSLAEIAQRYGCEYGKIDHQVIEDCEFVITYNSTFVVDCLLRGVKVAQYAPGTFYQTEPVTYTKGSLVKDVPDKTEIGYKLADFLAWKYCFNKEMHHNDIMGMVRHFASSKEIFPMEEEFCYANNLYPEVKPDLDYNPRDILDIFEPARETPWRSPRAVSEAVKDIIQDKVVCDLGCGEGDSLMFMLKYAKDVVGVEMDEGRSGFATKLGLNVVLANYKFMQKLPEADVYYTWTNWEQNEPTMYQVFRDESFNGTLIIAGDSGWEPEFPSVLECAKRGEVRTVPFDEGEGWRQSGEFKLAIITRESWERTKL